MKKTIIIIILWVSLGMYGMIDYCRKETDIILKWVPVIVLGGTIMGPLTLAHMINWDKVIVPKKNDGDK